MANGHGGRRPGAGRKPKAQDLELHGILSDVWNAESRRAALQRVVDIADSERADALDAIKLLLAYTYGKPIDRKEISGPDGEPLKAYVSVNPDEWDSEPTDTAD